MESRRTNINFKLIPDEIVCVCVCVINAQFSAAKDPGYCPVPSP